MEAANVEGWDRASLAGGAAGLPPEARGEVRGRPPGPRGGPDAVRCGGPGPPPHFEAGEGPRGPVPRPPAGGPRPGHREVPPRHRGGRVPVGCDPEEDRPGSPRTESHLRGCPRRRPADGPRGQQDPDVLGHGVRRPARRSETPPGTRVLEESLNTPP